MFAATSLIAPGSAAFKVLDGVADATNFLLIAWLLGVLIAGTKRKTLGGKEWLAVALSVACVYIVKTLDGKLDLWERADLNYSSHSALVAALVLSLFFLDRPRRALALAVFVVYEMLLMLLGFHSLLDILSTLIVVAPVVLLCLKLIIPKSIEALD